MGFRQWLLTEEAIPAGAIKIDLPSVRQQKNYTCGVAALKAIAKLHGSALDEKRLAELLKSNSEDGTSPENIVRIGKLMGLRPKAKVGMSLKELIQHLENKCPVICSMQAWGKPEDYPKAKSGHYVVAIGFTEDRIYFEDPSIKGSRGYLKYQEFNERWHDVDCHGHDCSHLGIVFLHSPDLHDEKTPRKAQKIK
jgi:predicted double-glycine peptidase